MFAPLNCWKCTALTVVTGSGVCVLCFRRVTLTTFHLSDTLASGPLIRRGARTAAY